MKRILTALHSLGRGFLFLLLTALAGCGPAQQPNAVVATPTPAPAAVATPKPMPARPQLTGLRATLEDQVTELPDDRIKWNTYWVLSWDPVPGVESYNIQVLTSEGRSPKLLSVTEPRYRLQAATGENAKAEGFVKRDIQLALHTGSLAVRVRAQLPGDSTRDKLPSHLASGWSALFDVGKATAPK